LDRDDAGRVVSVGFPSGVSEAYTYDAAGRPLTVTVAQGGAELASFEVTRDDAGRIATFLDAFDTDTRSGSFDYDTGGRLTGASSTDGTGSAASAFTLDAAGNRTEVTGDGAETASFNALDQLVSDGDATYVYDASGFLTQITDGTGTTDLSFSSAGELLGVNGTAGAVSYAYDAAGVLVSRTDATGTVGLVNDASGSLPHAVAATDGSWWVYAGSRPLAQATPDGQVHYLHQDVRGDVRLVTDEAGAVTDTFTYSVDGEVAARTGTTPVSVGWNGEYTDPTTGMVWLRARWYDPTSARFITADPWQGNPASPVSLNRYLYANADPINNTDPSGLFTGTLAEQDATIALQLEINSISSAYYLGLLSTLRTATMILAATAGVLTTGGAAYWLTTNQAGDPTNDLGVDGGNDPVPEPQPAPIGPGGPNDPPKTMVDTCQIPPGQDPDVFYFYQRADQMLRIESSGVRAVGPQGKIWLTSTLFASSAEAQSALALPDPAPDGYYEVPRDRLEDLYGPYCVEPYFGQAGGGLEYWTTRPINMEGLTWHPMQ
jgi:RHS repeat-associated protein